MECRTVAHTTLICVKCRERMYVDKILYEDESSYGLLYYCPNCEFELLFLFNQHSKGFIESKVSLMVEDV